MSSTSAISLKVQAAVFRRQASSFPNDTFFLINSYKFVTIALKRNESLSHILKLQQSKMYTITHWNVRLSEYEAHIRATFTKLVLYIKLSNSVSVYQNMDNL
jgi:hypothetical protein